MFKNFDKIVAQAALLKKHDETIASLMNQAHLLQTKCASPEERAEALVTLTGSHEAAKKHLKLMRMAISKTLLCWMVDLDTDLMRSALQSMTEQAEAQKAAKKGGN
jgi:BioD-like phosphotransacetylase family protein